MLNIEENISEILCSLHHTLQFKLYLQYKPNYIYNINKKNALFLH